MRFVTFFILVLLVLSVSACSDEQLLKLAGSRGKQTVDADDSEPAVASVDDPFTAVQEYYVMPSGDSVKVEFSLYVHDGSIIGLARLGLPEEGNSLTCRGPSGGETYFAFSASAMNLNPVMRKTVTMTATMYEFTETDPGTYKCTVQLYDDLGNKLYSAPFELIVTAA